MQVAWGYHQSEFGNKKGSCSMGSRENGRARRPHSNGVVAPSGQSRPPPAMVPLAALLAYELKNDIVENPLLRCGLALQPRKGEDFALVKTDCQRIPGDGSSTFAVFGVGQPFSHHAERECVLEYSENCRQAECTLRLIRASRFCFCVQNSLYCTLHQMWAGFIS
jgi:hypothetical protein